MKKAKQEKKKIEPNKGVKLPIIQNNPQKGKLKENQENSSKGKNLSKETEQKKNLKEIPPMPNISLNKSIPKNKKSFISTHLSQNSSKERGKSEINKKSNIKEEINQKKILGKEEASKFTEERLSQLKQQRKQRIIQEKKEEKKEIELYEKLIEEYKGNSKEKLKNIKNEVNEENPKINVSSKKAQTILEEGGMLDAYKYVLAQLCKNGLPSGNIFEYASIVVKDYEKKWKEKKSQLMKDKIDKYYEEKQNEINKSLDGEMNINKSLEHRNELKFIQSLDKSRSGRNVIPRIIKTIPKNDRFSYLGSNYLEIIKILNQQSKSKGKNKEKVEKNSPNKLNEDNPEIDNSIENINSLNSDLRPKENQNTNISANKRNINKNNIKLKK